MSAEAVVSYSPRASAAQAKSVARSLKVECEFRPGSIRILANADGTGMDAMRAAAEAALALIAALGADNAMIESVKLVADAKKSERAFVSRGSLSKEKPRPQTLMGEVSAPRPLPDNRREAFRNFMTAHRLRPTIWAKDAGVSSGEILGYLTGRSRGFSGEVAEKLARAAKVRVEDMFR